MDERVKRFMRCLVKLETSRVQTRYMCELKNRWIKTVLEYILDGALICAATWRWKKIEKIKHKMYELLSLFPLNLRRPETVIVEGRFGCKKTL